MADQPPTSLSGVTVYKGMTCCPYCRIEADDATLERARLAINENVDGITLKKASEGHPWAEEAIAKAVLRAVLDERNRP